MKVKLGFISYGELTSIVNEIKGSYSSDVEFYIVDTALENVVDMAVELRKKYKIDVFISAGANGYILKNSNLFTYVDITPTTTDFLLSLKEASKFSQEVALITYQSKRPYLNEIKSLLNYKIHERVYKDVTEIDNILDELNSLGVKSVIGSSLIREKAIKKGIKGFMLYSKSGVGLAIDKAINIAQVAKEKDRLNERLKAMMDITYEGIIATDKNGIIEIYNKSAERISQVNANEAIGRNITEILSTTRLDKVLKNNKEELDQSQMIGNVEIITNRVPITINDEVVGAIATFQTVDIIQKTEEKIRRRLNNHGFVADIKFSDIIGQSDVIRKAITKAKVYSKSDSTVLITGGSGTGKDLFAQSIHNYSLRNTKPFVAINCAALPESVLESELFGYEEGAFTGSRKGGKLGVFELAHNGTIFLDEIGEIPLAMQARLLRVLEKKEVFRIGGQKIIPIDVRIISATNKNLWEMVQNGQFREDLYYRICVLELHIPTLRERSEDIPLLIQKFMRNYRPSLDEKKIIEISENELFKCNAWDGNVRELKNIIERFSVLYTGNVNVSELIKEVLFYKDERYRSNNSYVYQRTIDECNGNKSEAARKLGISRTTLWRRSKGNKI